MFNSRTDLILNIIKNNLNKSNAEIARILMEKHSKEFSGWKLDSVRRKISKVRIKNKLNNNINKEDNKLNNEILNKDLEKTESYVEYGNNAVSEKITTEQVKTLEDLIQVAKIDTNVWKIDKWECSVFESHTKLRKFEHIDGKFQRIDDVHKVQPLYRVKCYMSKKVEEIKLVNLKNEIIEEMKKYAPVYKKIDYKIDKKEKGYLLEISLADLHYGLMSWDEESGYNYDIKIAKELYLNAISKLLNQSKGFNISKILFVVGNDFFNVDSVNNTTTAGTPQDEDTRWKKTFKKGRELLIEGIDLVSQVAHTDVLIVPGNHDTQRTFFVGDALECWYRNNKNVNINNSPKVRKYYQFGKCMIMHLHGKDEKLNELPLLMASEEPKMWADTIYREAHAGEIHHTKQVKWLSAEDYKGVTVRYLRTLSVPSNWAYSKGFIGSIRAGDAFIWDEENGLICQLSANV